MQRGKGRGDMRAGRTLFDSFVPQWIVTLNERNGDISTVDCVGRLSLLCTGFIDPVNPSRHDSEARFFLKNPYSDIVQSRLIRSGVETQRVAVVNVVGQDRKHT